MYTVPKTLYVPTPAGSLIDNNKQRERCRRGTDPPACRLLDPQCVAKLVQLHETDSMMDYTFFYISTCLPFYLLAHETYMHTCIHTCTHAHIHTLIHSFSRARCVSPVLTEVDIFTDRLRSRRDNAKDKRTDWRARQSHQISNRIFRATSDEFDGRNTASVANGLASGVEKDANRSLANGTGEELEDAINGIIRHDTELLIRVLVGLLE